MSNNFVVKKIEVTHHKAETLHVDVRPRYWEDCKINDKDYKERMTIPFKDSESWKVVIELSSGTILNWPKDTTMETTFKVCDDGDYSLYDSDNKPITSSIEVMYVPSVLCRDENNCGNYVSLTIDENGKISNWNNINLDEFDDHGDFDDY